MKVRIDFNTTDHANDFVDKYNEYSLGSFSQSEWTVTLFNMSDKAELFTRYYISELNKNKRKIDYIVYIDRI